MKAAEKKNNLMLKLQQIFRTEKHYAFTDGVNKIALSANYDKAIQLVESIHAYKYGTN